MSTLLVELADGLSVEHQRRIAETLHRVYGNNGPVLASPHADAADRTREVHKASK
jgi:hypothetical protein